MKTRQEIKIGDAVEVEVLCRPTLSPVVATKPPVRSEPIREWLPATVVEANREKIGVAFSDGERLALPRFSNQWRPA